MPMVRAFALPGEAIGQDRARVRMPNDPEHANSRADVHGGAISVLFDCDLLALATGTFKLAPQLRHADTPSTPPNAERRIPNPSKDIRRLL